VPVGAGPVDVLAQHASYRPGGRRRLQRGAQVEGPGRGEDLDREHPLQAVDRATQLAGRGPAHRDVVLLHRAGRDRVDARRCREPLQLGHDRGLGVLRDHVPGVDAGIVGQERVQPVVAGHVQEAVGTTLADAGHVRGRDGEEVQHVPDRGTVEVAVGLDPAVRHHHRVVDRRGQLTAGDQQGVRAGVAGGAVHLRRAAQRVRVLDPVAVRPAVTGHDRAVRHDRPQVGGRRALARVRAQCLQVVGEHPVGTELRLHAHRGGDVGGAQQPVQIGQRQHQHAEHAVGAVDQRQPFLLGEYDGPQTGFG
jgi:hypothetical protein